MYSSIISEDRFSIIYVLDEYKAQRMCDRAVDYCLVSLIFVPDCFGTSKMIKIRFIALHADEDILC